MTQRHIIINTPLDCCGCEACRQVCPVSCIEMHEDKHGFLYPHVDIDKCINCGKCRKACTIINPQKESIPIICFGAQRRLDSNTDKSTSVGTFYLLAKEVIDVGGVVFGARYNDDFSAVYHTSVRDIEDLTHLQKSKYMQSVIGDTFKECKFELENGRRVLFSGTPCQIAGLKRFLNKDYDNLLTVDLICHGVPSGKVWGDYLYSLVPKGSKVTGVDFRDNRLGWFDCGLSIKYTDTHGITLDNFSHCGKSPYFVGFNANIFLRDVCYDCPEKLGRSHSDITLGDYWGIRVLRPDLDTTQSVAVVLANTEKGVKSLDDLNLYLFDSSLVDIFTSNPNLYAKTKRPVQESIFWDRYEKEGIACLPEVLKTFHKSKTQHLLLYIKQIIALLIYWHKK